MQGNNKDWALLILRIVFGGFMLYGHGWRKLMKFFSDDPIKFANPFGLGAEASLGLTVFAEVLCAFLILIGFKSKWASIPLIITMIVAAFMIHGADPFGKKEMALIYLAGYVVIALLGSGKFSIDHLLKRNS